MRAANKSREQVAEYWREQQEARLSAQPRLQPPELRNLRGVVYFVDPHLRVPFRGRMYLVPSLPYEQGLKLAELQVRKAAWEGKDASAEALECLRDCWRQEVDIIRANTRPDRGGWLKQLLWRVTARWERFNPFRLATPLELGQLVGFLSLSQTIQHPLPPGVRDSTQGR